ncbi:hypothetical protein AB6A40_005102 [Gnathostoma spinigerum]|uniref:Craniofacial development protein 2-like n=1 Tax=Gnathostoma spinigerum TaxID=75299 RepID=A0ABD6EEL9_9BILA
MSCELTSSPIGVLYLQIGKKVTLKIVKAYAPTTASDDEVEELYESSRELRLRKPHTIVMGDINAEVGRREDGEYYFVRRYGPEKENDEERCWRRWQKRRSYSLQTHGLKRRTRQDGGDNNKC